MLGSVVLALLHSPVVGPVASFLWVLPLLRSGEPLHLLLEQLLQLVLEQLLQLVLSPCLLLALLPGLQLVPLPYLQLGRPHLLGYQGEYSQSAL